MEHAFFTDILSILLSGIIAFLFWKIKQFEGKDYVTQEQLDKRLDVVSSEFDKLEIKLDVMSDQIIQIGITLARIDERMKRDNG